MEISESICKVKPDTEAIFMSSRIRLARNLAGEVFSPILTDEGKSEILSKVSSVLSGIRKFEGGLAIDISKASELDGELLCENNMISRELLAAKGARGAFISKDATTSVMVNEEDHLRIQMIARGLCLESLWKKINLLDDRIEKSIPYAFSEKYGYLTACPSNVGTGMRASVMMHLTGLALIGDIEKVVRGLSQLGIVARGSNGEGSDPIGGFYQISNQQTLGFQESNIIERVTNICAKIATFEQNARLRLLESNPEMLYDKIARAQAVIDACRIITSAEATECLSVMRLAADLGFIPAKSKVLIDEMLLNVRQAHLKFVYGNAEMSVGERDILRAQVLKQAFKSIKKAVFPKAKKVKKSV